ncbi:MAG: diguanylate cyclase [Geobacteraceae bacterium]
MGVPLRVLIIEESADNVLLLSQKLRDGGYVPECRQVDNAEEMAAALAESGWDIVVADYMLPRFSSMAALELLQQQGLDLPFIIVSDHIGAETAVEAVKSGAHDYLFRDRLDRLAEVIRRELREAHIRRERREEEETLRGSERRFRATLENIGLLAFWIDMEGRITFCNDSLLELTGWRRNEVIGRLWSKIFLPECDVIWEKFFSTIKSGSLPSHYEDEIVTCKGERRLIFWSNTLLLDYQGNVEGLACIGNDITERRQAEAKLRYMSTHDHLTGLYNRSYFDEELERLERSRKYPVSVLMADVDGLKEVNDILGHAAGDKLLQEVGQILTDVFRAEDVVARIGGDEFAVLLPGADETATVEAMNRIRQIIILNNENRQMLPLKLSMGFATACTADVQLTMVCRIADDRMYQDKLGRYGRLDIEP